MVSPTIGTIEDIIDDCCPCPEDYCILKKIIMISGLNDRFLEQVKCIERFRYERNNKDNGKIDLKEASELWVEEGYAKKFSETYKQGMKNGELYGLIMGGDGGA